MGLVDAAKPCAEAWFGAHPLAPADVVFDGRSVPLDALIQQQDAILGPEVRARGAGLPYLLKILAAERPLSIQVHPDGKQAEEGFAREDRAGIPRHAPHRCYRDPNPKPELLVALTPFEALCGFRPWDEMAGAIRRLPELSRLLPAFDPTPDGLRIWLEAYLRLDEADAGAALQAVIDRLATSSALETDEQRVLETHRLLQGTWPDRGLVWMFLLALVQLDPGQAIYLGAGVPHAYLGGAGVELMASSDNVLRAGLTTKHVDPAELMRVIRLDVGAPQVLEAPRSGHDYPVPSDVFCLRRWELGAGKGWRGVAEGPDTLLAMGPPASAAMVRWDGGKLRLRPGQACLVPHGVAYTVEAEAPMTVFRAHAPSGSELDAADPLTPAVAEAVQRNLATARRLFEQGTVAGVAPPRVVCTVSGSAAAQAYWQRHLDRAAPGLRATEVVSLHEDLPVNQAFGLLLAWQRLRDRVVPGQGCLAAFVFGEGTRAAPFTQAEGGQKPAIRSFVAGDDGRLSTVELALRTFAPVEAYLRRSGFEGLVVKWGDEVQVPTLDLSGSDPRLADADVVRFVSIQEITEGLASSKDWVGVDPDGRITAFIPRRRRSEMGALADRGLLQRRAGRLFGGINLGSIAMSRPLLDRLLAEFAAEIADPTADRRQRPDLDPQLFTALTVAAIPDGAARAAAWSSSLQESAAMRSLERHLPGVLDRLRRVVEQVETDRGRRLNLVALDFGDQYWGDIGQHRQMYAWYMALRAPGPSGEVARALAGLSPTPDSQGNWIAGSTRLGPGVEVHRSVLIDVQVSAGRIEDCVLIGTRADEVHAVRAFDVESSVRRLHLGPRAGSYKVVAPEMVRLGPGERAASVFLDSGPLLARVHEDSDLRDRASTYDVPILGNPLPFAELHRRVLQGDPAAVEERRSAHRRWVEDGEGPASG